MRKDYPRARASVRARRSPNILSSLRQKFVNLNKYYSKCLEGTRRTWGEYTLGKTQRGTWSLIYRAEFKRSGAKALRKHSET